jgi:hypothetical protein
VVLSCWHWGFCSWKILWLARPRLIENWGFGNCCFHSKLKLAMCV